jgi:hypothetical protein
LFYQLWSIIWAGRNLVKMNLLNHHCLTEFESNTHQTIIIIIGSFYLKRPVSIVTPTSQKFEGWIWRFFPFPFLLGIQKSFRASRNKVYNKQTQKQTHVERQKQIEAKFRQCFRKSENGLDGYRSIITLNLH